MQFFDFTINPLISSNAIPVRKSLVDFRNLRTKQMPFLSESITERGIDPYGTLSLGEGIHLHFILPSAKEEGSLWQLVLQHRATYIQ